MYIRRKVFSKIGEKTYSTTEFQTQKEFAEKKKSTEKIDGESKKEKALKAATIGGAVVAAGGAADSLASRRVEKFARKVGDLANMGRGNIYQGAERRTIQKGKFNTEIPKLTKEESLKVAELENLENKAEKVGKKLSKHSRRAAIISGVGLGTSIAAGTAYKAYKALKKKKDQKEFAEKKEDGKKESKKISKSDKANIWIAKNLATKKDREAAIKAYDKDSKDFSPLAKRTAIGAGIGGGIVGAGFGAAAGPDLIGKTGKHVKKKMAAGGAVGALGYGALTAGSAYAGSKLNGKLVNKARSKSEKSDKKYQKTADINKVASGKMTKEEFAEKYGK